MSDGTHTNLSLLTDSELLLHVYNKEDPSDLELELVGRLESAMDYEDELRELLEQYSCEAVLDGHV